MTGTYPAIVPFHSDGMDGLERGTDGLLYVMAHGHGVTVPTDVLMCAEKAGVISIARRDTPAAVLNDVNRALDTIAATLRVRVTLDAAPTAAPAFAPADRGHLSGGHAATLVPPAPTRPPAGTAIHASIEDAVLTF